MTHFGIPWPVVRWAFRAARKLFATVEVPEQDHLVTSASIDDLREALGRAHFTNGWELSYHYRGEDLNMRRPEYVDDDPAGRPWYQLHVRGFEHANREVSLFPHLEYEPTEYPELHLHEVNFNVDEALSMLADVLDEAGVDYELKVV